MERKDLEDLIQRLWDQGASIEIMKILEHDKLQREALARVEAELKATDQKLLAKTGAHEFLKYGVNNLVKERDTAEAQLAEAVAVIHELRMGLDLSGLSMLTVDVSRINAFLTQAEQQQTSKQR